MSVLEHFDYKDYNSRMGENAELMALVASEYLRESEEIMDRLELAVAGMDFEKVRSIAHRLKGASSEVSAQSLSDLCKRLEDAAKANDDGQVLALMRVLKAAYKTLLLEIKETLAL
ncbi:Hpt domain-containing protein [Rhodanobacter aciditrophus]|uniref:Hpt domain-containing protein n=1 Tax=Rhodanobacter aciditrophus TaxID=1623218 RepID=A0ABW4AZL5_9GAMM